MKNGFSFLFKLNDNIRISVYIFSLITVSAVAVLAISSSSSSNKIISITDYQVGFTLLKFSLPVPLLQFLLFQEKASKNPSLTTSIRRYDILHRYLHVYVSYAFIYLYMDMDIDVNLSLSILLHIILTFASRNRR